LRAAWALKQANRTCPGEPPEELIPEPRRSGPESVLHGGPDYAELARLGLKAGELLDFSVNSNPLGASPRARHALGTVDPSRYPDSQALQLTAHLAASHGVDPCAVLVGNGSVDLIWRLAQIYVEPGDTALVVGPTFGEYEAVAQRQGAEVVVFRASAEEEFQPRITDLVATLLATRPRLVFVCNPNNPTGQALGLSELEALLGACDETLLIVDEAYIDFVDDGSFDELRTGPTMKAAGAMTPSVSDPGCSIQSALALRDDPRMVVLRSLTKNMGLAGLRLGYAVAASQVIDALGRAQPPWSVNAFAQAAGLAALGDWEHVAAGRRAAQAAKSYLLDGLTRLGLICLPSCANFWLVEVGDAAELRRRLLLRGILVRDCASFGLPRHIRLSARPLSECERLLQVFAELV
jgi:histidinol-phosphate aminotransferase